MPFVSRQGHVVSLAFIVLRHSLTKTAGNEPSRSLCDRHSRLIAFSSDSPTLLYPTHVNRCLHVERNLFSLTRVGKVIAKQERCILCE